MCKFREQSFDITFMDVKLPGMSGVESFFEMRNLKPDAKVFMMTAYSVEQLLSQAIDAGALGVLHKPFELDVVLRILETVKPEGIILVADDDRDFVRTTEDLLTDAGYIVHVAGTGREAVDKALANDFHVLILDLKLPILSGLEVYLELKKHNRLIPTVIVTGHAEEVANLDRLRSVPVAGCLVKPFDFAQLLQAIAALVVGQPNKKFHENQKNE